MNNAIHFLAVHMRRGPAQRDPNLVFHEGLTVGQRLADRVAAIGGSWAFITGFCVFLVGWAILNSVVLATRAFDPFPFIFLNLMLSMLAAVQAPIIMMSQNRQAEKDRFDARLDYETNQRAEIQINQLHEEVLGLKAQLRLLTDHLIGDVETK